MAVRKGKEVVGKAAFASPSPSSPAVASTSSGKRKKPAVASPSSSPDDGGPVGKKKKKKKKRSVNLFIDDAALDDGEEDALDDDDDFDDLDFDDDIEVGMKDTKAAGKSLAGKSQRLPFFLKEEELSGDELEELIKERYGRGSESVVDDEDTKEFDDRKSLMHSSNDPAIWRVKCMVGRERQIAFCLIQKYLHLHSFGTKLPIISVFALEHVKGYVYIEADKESDIVEALKGFCNLYPSKMGLIPKSEVPSLLSVQNKSSEILEGTWVRVKNGNYKGDLAQVVAVDEGRKQATIKLVPRIDLQAMAKKFGSGVSLKHAAIPVPRLISTHELEDFRPHIQVRCDRQSGELFEILDGLMLKDGYLYKKVSIVSLSCFGVQPSPGELSKFEPAKKDEPKDSHWISRLCGGQKNVPLETLDKDSEIKKGNGYELHELVFFGRKDFGIIIAMEGNSFQVLKDDTEGPVIVTVQLREIKSVCADKMFIASDRHMKTISIKDIVRVSEGPLKGRQGVVKHLYKGTLFVYGENQLENSGFFCAKAELCENMKDSCGENLGFSSSQSGLMENFESPSVPQSFERSSQQRDSTSGFNRYPQGDRDQRFSIGQTLRIRVGPLKGYLCRVVRMYRSDVTVKLDSQAKLITVDCNHLSDANIRSYGNTVRDDTMAKTFDQFGTQERLSRGGLLDEGLGAPLDKSSWDFEVPPTARDSWQGSTSGISFASHEDNKVDKDQEADPWGSKATSGNGGEAGGSSKPMESWDKATVSGGGADPWGSKATSGNGGEAGGSSKAMASWDKATVSGGGADPWGSKATSGNGGEAGGSSKAMESWDKATGSGGGAGPWGSKATSGNGGEAGGSSKAMESWDKATGSGGGADPWGSKATSGNGGEAGGSSKAMESWDKATGSGEGACSSGEADLWGSKATSGIKGEAGNSSKAMESWDKATGAGGGADPCGSKATSGNRGETGGSSKTMESWDKATGSGGGAGPWGSKATSGNRGEAGSSSKAMGSWDKATGLGGDQNSWSKSVSRDKADMKVQADSWENDLERQDKIMGTSGSSGADAWERTKPRTTDVGKSWGEKQLGGGNQTDPSESVTVSWDKATCKDKLDSWNKMTDLDSAATINNRGKGISLDSTSNWNSHDSFSNDQTNALDVKGKNVISYEADARGKSIVSRSGENISNDNKDHWGKAFQNSGGSSGLTWNSTAPANVDQAGGRDNTTEPRNKADGHSGDLSDNWAKLHNKLSESVSHKCSWDNAAGAWAQSAAKDGGGSFVEWKASSGGQSDSWNKAKDASEGEPGGWNKPKPSGGDQGSCWNKGSGTYNESDGKGDLGDHSGRPRRFEGGWGSHRGRGRGGRGGDSGDRSEDVSWSEKLYSDGGRGANRGWGSGRNSEGSRDQQDSWSRPRDFDGRRGQGRGRSFDGSGRGRNEGGSWNSPRDFDGGQGSGGGRGRGRWEAGKHGDSFNDSRSFGRGHGHGRGRGQSSDWKSSQENSGGSFSGNPTPSWKNDQANSWGKSITSGSDEAFEGNKNQDSGWSRGKGSGGEWSSGWNSSVQNSDENKNRTGGWVKQETFVANKGPSGQGETKGSRGSWKPEAGDQHLSNRSDWNKGSASSSGWASSGTDNCNQTKGSDSNSAPDWNTGSASTKEMTTGDRSCGWGSKVVSSEEESRGTECGTDNWNKHKASASITGSRQSLGSGPMKEAAAGGEQAWNVDKGSDGIDASGGWNNNQASTKEEGPSRQQVVAWNQENTGVEQAPGRDSGWEKAKGGSGSKGGW